MRPVFLNGKSSQSRKEQAEQTELKRLSRKDRAEKTLRSLAAGLLQLFSDEQTITLQRLSMYHGPLHRL
jgi:hypothetical protein